MNDQANDQKADEQSAATTRNWRRGTREYDGEMRKAFLRLGEEDEQRITGLKELIEDDDMEGIVDKLYEHFQAYEETSDFLDEEILVRLRKAQTAYFRRIFDGNFDQEYIEERLEIGRVHERIGLEPKWYIGAYARYINLLIPVLSQKFRGKPDDFVEALTSLNKIFFFDMGLAIDTYIEALMNREAELTDRYTETMQEYASRLEGMTQEIATAIAQQSASARQQAASISEVTSTAKELRESSEQAQEHAEEVIDRAEGSVSVAENGGEAIEESIDGMQEIRRQVESIAEKILNLSEQTQQIGEIIQSVNEIAEQSKLLALNAAIEASRAGEHGRGFSVVAGEIRTLADQSKEATNQVRGILGEIQTATNSAVIATEEGSKKVESGVDLAEKAGDTIHTLSDVTNQAADAARMISASSNQQTRGIEQVSEAMVQIDGAIRDFTAGLEQTEGASSGLEKMVQEMTDLVESFSNGDILSDSH